METRLLFFFVRKDIHMYNNNQYLKHYGILGMKWGRRKQGNIRESNAQKKQAKSIYLQNVKLKKDDELMHYGVLGMKWGVRKEQPRTIGLIGRTTVKGVAGAHKTVGKIQRRAAKKAKADELSIRTQKKQMLDLTKNGKPLFTEKQVDDMATYYADHAKKLESKANKHEQFANQLLSEIGEIKMRDLKK